MRISDLLDLRSIDLKAAPKNKQETLEMACELMNKSGKLNDLKAYEKQVFAREDEGTTGVGDGIAIPHGRCAAVNAPGLAAMVIPAGVDFDSMDGTPVTLLFLIAAPETKDNVHLDVLSKLSVLMMQEAFTEKLRAANTPEEFISIIDEFDTEEKPKEATVPEEATKKRILAVTSCPTGIAHTYMAAEALEKAARANNCFIKVETRGSSGAKNVVTEDEIRDADAIIIAADTKVPMSRFAGKKVIECQVSDGIGKADELIKRALSGDVPVYKEDAAGNDAKASHGGGATGGNTAHQLYMHLMNGVSHMLPFVVGGGILIAIAFLIDTMSVDMASLSAEVRANFGTITPLAATFKGIGNAAFSFMLPILSGYIAMSIADRPGLAVGFVGGYIAANGKSGFLGALLAGFIAGYLILILRQAFDKLPKTIEKIAPVLLYPVVGILLIGLIMNFIIEPPVGALNQALNNGLSGMSGSSKILLGAVVAGMMAIDMGGPFNKAAYVFGTASIVSGNYDVMAAVMIGGMVPPCAIALATILFKNKFTKEERESGPTNFIMGLAFITEGAIPYAASDPLRVIPSCVIGSAAAGALSMVFGCTLMAPHGGIFVFPVVGNALMYLAALVIGTVVSAMALGVFKRNAEQ